MPWVTINGNHVLIGEDAGGGASGTHNPAVETGHAHVDKILPKRSADTMSEAIAQSSPSGRMSARAKDAALKRLSTQLFGEGGLQKAAPAQESEAANMLRNAKQLRQLAAGGMSVKKFTKQADLMEQAAKSANPKATFAALLKGK